MSAHCAVLRVALGINRCINMEVQDVPSNTMFDPPGDILIHD